MPQITLVSSVTTHRVTARGPLHPGHLTRHSRRRNMVVTDTDRAVGDALRAGQEAWPGLSLDEEDLAAWVRDHDIGVEALRARGADLYLAAGCSRGDARALALFDRTFLQAPGPNAGRATLRREQLDELRQRLRVRLLSGPNPRISSFQGQGPLAAWVRVAAARLASDLLWGQRADGQRDGSLIDALVDAGADPELVAARREHHHELRAALEHCIGSLGAREKTLLRMSFLDQMNIDEIAVVYRAHRATVARWLVAIRRQVFEGLCERLSIKLRSSPSEVASLVRMARSQVDLSIGRLLGGDQVNRAAAKTRDHAGGGD
jgi:RNA polymerase sigma-70 factor, ECF subfamily